MARGSPSVSHLLFADDSLFICKENKEEGETILKIIKQYKMVSSQQINFTKSSLQFGHTVDNTVRDDMKQILGISNNGGMGSYLGLPES